MTVRTTHYTTVGGVASKVGPFHSTTRTAWLVRCEETSDDARGVRKKSVSSEDCLNQHEVWRGSDKG